MFTDLSLQVPMAGTKLANLPLQIPSCKEDVKNIKTYSKLWSSSGAIQCRIEAGMLCRYSADLACTDSVMQSLL
jgi:hypothetical protein